MRRGSLEKQEEKYEEKKQHDGIPAGGYLIGRHPECGTSLYSSDADFLDDVDSLCLI